MEKSIITKILHKMDEEMSKNFIQPPDEITEEQRALYELDFYSAESFKIGFKLCAEIFCN